MARLGWWVGLTNPLLLERIFPEERPALKACMQRLLAGAAEEGDVLYRVLHAERGEVWVEGKAALVHGGRR